MHPALDAPVDMAFVLGLLADLERGCQKLQQKLAEAQLQAQAQHGPLESVRTTWLAQNQQLRALQVTVNQAARSLAEANGQVASLMQNIGNLARKSDELRAKMQLHPPDSDLYRQLRRARAALSVQLEDRNKDLATQQSAAAAARQQLEAAHKQLLEDRDAARSLSATLKNLQALQPPAAICLDLFGHLVSQAHGLLLLEANDMPAPKQIAAGGSGPLPPRAQAAKAAWRTRLLAASAHVVKLYQDLAAGRYAVEAATSWAGGRCVAASESLYALVALGELEAAIELFGLSCANDAFFHHIFEPFRGGCLGLFLVGRHRELGEALRLHQDAPGLRGAYVQAYSALLGGQQALFYGALQAIAQAEWRQWRKTSTPGLGLVNLAVLGLAELSRLRGFAMPPIVAPSVPWILRPRQ